MGLIGHIGPIGKENSPVKPYSKNSKRGNRPLCLFSPLASKNTFAQEVSKMSKSSENYSAQPHSKFSKLRNRPLSPSCLFSPLVSKTPPVERLSKNSNLGFGCSYPVHNAVFTGKRLFVPGIGKTIALFNFLRIKLRFFG